MKNLLIAALLAASVPSVAGSLIRSEVPEPVYAAEPSFVDLYYTAWDMVEDHIRFTPGLASPRYLDEGCMDGNGPATIWIWDTEFMAMFCKYAPGHFPGVESLRNFYLPLLDGASSPLRIHHPDNPPLFAWIEHDYYKFTADRAHLDSLMLTSRYPQRYFDMFNSLDDSCELPFGHQKVLLKRHDIGFEWGPNQCGMDNTPRCEDGDIYWLDAISQQALSALYTARLARICGDYATERRFRKEYGRLKSVINRYYWDETDGCYYDIFQADSSVTRILTPASFWPMLAEVPSRRQAGRMAEFALDPGRLGGVRPWKSADPKNRLYVAEGGKYWRGAIWLPTAYMGIKALEKYGMMELADRTALDLLKQVESTYRNYEPYTIWECYDPSADKPALNKKNRTVRPDFCGWSALAPISLFIENVIGIYDVDAPARTVRWNLHNDFEHGVRHLRFGGIETDLVYSDGRISIRSNGRYALIVNGRRFRVRPGEQVVKVKV